MQFFILVLIGLLGIMIHWILKFQDAVTKTPKNGMKMKARFNLVWVQFDLLGHLTYSIFAFLIVLLVIVLREPTETLTVTAMVTVLMAGYAADSSFKNLQSRKGGI